jgi:hypothetical protein
MNMMGVYRLGGTWAIALGLGVALFGVAYAQDVTVPANGGVVLGEVDRCNNGAETPAAGVTVGTDASSGGQVKTDNQGQFVLDIPPGTYTVIATADDGTSAIRPYVPVETGIAIDIGVLDLGMGAGSCGDTGVPAIILPTAVASATPVPTAAPAEATATPVPPTPAPDTTQPSDQSPAPADQPAPADETGASGT